MKKKGIKQYNKINLLILALWLVMILLISILVKKWWLGLLFFAVSYFIYGRINAKLKYKYVESILYQDLDAKRYYDELFFKSKNTPDLIQSIVANWFVGNHRQMESILEENVKNYEGNDKNTLLSYLKFVYFETRNKEKLKEVMNRAEEFPKGVAGEFFSNYLNGKYESCFVECDKIEEWLKNLKNKNKNLPFEMLRVEFMRAVTYYDMGDSQKSREIFEGIIRKAPDIHYADIASQYLKAMETGEEQFVSIDALFVDRCQVVNPKSQKKRRPWRVALIWILIVALVIGIVWGFLLNSDKNNEPRDEAQVLYDQKIHQYLNSHYSDYDILYGYRLGGEDIYVIKSNGKYSIIGYVFDLIEDNDPITAFTIYAENMDVDKRYEASLWSNNYKISFMITDNYYHVSPESFMTEKIELDGNEYYFAIASVRSNRERYNEAFDEVMTDEFGRYEVLYSYYLGDESAYIIKANDKLNIVIFGFEIDEWDKTTHWWIVKEGVDFGTKYSAYSRDYKAELSYMITESNANIPTDIVGVKQITIDGKDYFFVVWKEDNASNYSNTSSYDKNWDRFQDFVVDNPYDIWLEAELNEGIEMPWYIYSDYIKFWIAEYESTLEYANDFFNEEENYLSWKSDNEAWLELTRELYRKEVNNFDAQMERLEITILYAKLIRQKVIDTKYFLYQLEINEKIMVGDVSDEYVALKWKSIETDN